MGQIIKFEIGCRGCAYLERTGKHTYTCSTRVHMDDTPVVPIRDGKKTTDWDICSGKHYLKAIRRKRYMP